MKARIVIFTGAGISAESGLKTFRGAGGLWEGVPVQEVATPDAWDADFRKVLRFYNERRKSVAAAKPNAAHEALVLLEESFVTDIITQNIDDLHERAGSSSVLHLHGQIFKSRSSIDENLVYDLKSLEINEGDLCELGSQLRPHIVWFGEAVPMMEPAIDLVRQADIFLIVGSSLEVYPAASLINYTKRSCRRILIDPHPTQNLYASVETIADLASVAVPRLVETLKDY